MPRKAVVCGDILCQSTFPSTVDELVSANILLSGSADIWMTGVSVQRACALLRRKSYFANGRVHGRCASERGCDDSIGGGGRRFLEASSGLLRKKGTVGRGNWHVEQARWGNDRGGRALTH